MKWTSTTTDPALLTSRNATFDVRSKAECLIARFESAVPSSPNLLCGQVQDIYGWWHGPYVVDTSTARSFTELRTISQPDPAPFDVRIEFLHAKGLRLVVPDEIALELKRWKNEHWNEIPGVGDGYSATPYTGTEMHRWMAYLHAVQSATNDDMPFIEGAGFRFRTTDYDLLVSTCGIGADRARPDTRWYFHG